MRALWGLAPFALTLLVTLVRELCQLRRQRVRLEATERPAISAWHGAHIVVREPDGCRVELRPAPGR